MGALASFGALIALAITPAQGAVPTGFTHAQVASGLIDPTDIEFAPGGRQFVAEEAGKLLIAKPNGTLTIFLDILSKVDATGERGLMGVAFDPNFATNHFVYLQDIRKAIATTSIHNRVSRVIVNGGSCCRG